MLEPIVIFSLENISIGTDFDIGISRLASIELQLQVDDLKLNKF